MKFNLTNLILLIILLSYNLNFADIVLYGYIESDL